VRTLTQTLAKLGDPRVVVSGIEVGDLEVALRDLHGVVELERLHEGGNRLVIQSLVVVQNAQVVVRAGVRRVDSSGERAEDLAVALRGEWCRRQHDHATRIALRMAPSDAVSGRSRKNPRSFSSDSLSTKSLSTQKTKSLSPPNCRYVVVSTASDMSMASAG